uniref:Uncharacterized protein n=1 Tax=Arundo donax TaxID=35708 RepID=A0A0A9HJN0_ARUDO
MPAPTAPGAKNEEKGEESCNHHKCLNADHSRPWAIPAMFQLIRDGVCGVHQLLLHLTCVVCI